MPTEHIKWVDKGIQNIKKGILLGSISQVTDFATGEEYYLINDPKGVPHKITLKDGMWWFDSRVDKNKKER